MLNNKKRKICFIDSVSPVSNNEGKVGLLFRLQSENATYFPSGYFYLDYQKKRIFKGKNFMRPGNWITIPSLKEKRILDNVEPRYHVLSFDPEYINPNIEITHTKDEEIGKIEDNLDELPENPTFELDGEENLKVAVVRVGQGDLILVRFPSGQGIIIDANYNALNKDRVSAYIKKFFNGTQPKALIISHKHLDHIRYAEEIARDFKIGECWWPVCRAHRHSGPTVRRIIINMRRNGVRILAINKTLVYKVSKDFKISFRYPAAKLYDHNVNPNYHSIVIDIELKEHRVILGGDLMHRGWGVEYGNDLPKIINFFKVPHHGSKEGLNFKMVSKTKILNSVTSCAQRNRYLHPHCEPLKSYFNSGEHRITCLTNGDAIVYEIGRNGVSRTAPPQQNIYVDCQLLSCFIKDNAHCVNCDNK